jgi:hypothetical protein
LTRLIQLLIKLVKLRGLCHNIFIDDEWRLDFLVPSFAEEVEGISDEGLVKVDAVICEEVAAVTCNLGP